MFLFRWTRRAEEEDLQLLKAGFAWQPKWENRASDNKTSENVWRASHSRSLARLEERGLIVRIKGARNARTLRVKLTNEGRRVAEHIGTH